MYAQRCMALGSREARRAYLADVVPAQFRDWVRLYVEQGFRRGKSSDLNSVLRAKTNSSA